MWNCDCEIFEYHALLLFSLEVVLQDVAKNNPTENQIDAGIQATPRHASVWKLTEEKM